MKTIFEEQGVEYHQAGDYMLPNVEQAEQNAPLTSMKKNISYFPGFRLFTRKNKKTEGIK